LPIIRISLVNWPFIRSSVRLNGTPKDLEEVRVPNRFESPTSVYLIWSSMVIVQHLKLKGLHYGQISPHPSFNHFLNSCTDHYHSKFSRLRGLSFDKSGWC